MRELRVVADRVVRGTPAQVWPYASDSERINRVAGLPPLRFEEHTSEDSAARLLGHVTVLGWTLSFEEHPTVFEVERFAEWRRVFGRGPFRDLVIRAELEPVTATTTRVRGVITCDLRWTFLAKPLRWALGVGVRDLPAAVARLVEGAHPPLTPPYADTLASAAERLRARSDAPCADVLVEHVAQAEDFVVQRIRPYALADSLALSRRDMLSTCVAAAEVGLLDLSWILVCPSCRNGTESLPSLQDLASDEGRCHACELRFTLDMDRSVEVVFAPHAAVRKPHTGTYCSGGPARTPHVVAQVNVAAGAEGVLHAPRNGGHYRLVARGGGGTVRVDVVDAAAGSVEVTLGAEDGAPRVEVAPGGTVRARHVLPHPVHVKLEHLDQRDDAVTARDLGMLPAFRRRYATETLRPGLSLKVGRVALLFSDLADSTRLYCDMGDSTAFRIVQDHFAVLEVPIAAHGGTVVKTIGDAVMAVFPDEAAAVGAGVDILVAFGPFRAAVEGRGRTDIKIGVFAGPCYVVTANGILDYFGQTVNTAARLQGLAVGGELVVEAQMAASARATGAQVGPAFAAELKGLRERVDVVRVRWPMPAPVPTSDP